ncbi:hypothetical protein BD410DRAFT_791278 [Rickenella mellea]|uniref:Uncharacterized protein n=1 Tax=Rickenella mellea TaxID=50990 RepID=A0A4Y7Q059_9AGAM|nr:hypothetical protein BD410DRAFT_791278 [Rickenella mellea]
MSPEKTVNLKHISSYVLSRSDSDGDDKPASVAAKRSPVLDLVIPDSETRITSDDVGERDNDAISSSTGCTVGVSGRADEDLRQNVADDNSMCEMEDGPSEWPHSTDAKPNDMSLQMELPDPLITTEWIDSSEPGQGLHAGEKTRHPAHMMTVGTEGVQDVREKDDLAVSLASNKDGVCSEDEDKVSQQRTSAGNDDGNAVTLMTTE